MTVLLDVNVLIALADRSHVHHDRAHRWFVDVGHRDWATCPVTENGVLRILGHPRYPNSPGPPSAVAALLRPMLSLPGHSFWPDAISLFDPERMRDVAQMTSASLTDLYLLALAAERRGRLATFDHRMVPHSATSRAALLQIGIG